MCDVLCYLQPRLKALVKQVGQLSKVMAEPLPKRSRIQLQLAVELEEKAKVRIAVSISVNPTTGSDPHGQPQSGSAANMSYNANAGSGSGPRPDLRHGHGCNAAPCEPRDQHGGGGYREGVSDGGHENSQVLAPAAASDTQSTEPAELPHREPSPMPRATLSEAASPSLSPQPRTPRKHVPLEAHWSAISTPLTEKRHLKRCRLLRDDDGLVSPIQVPQGDGLPPLVAAWDALPKDCDDSLCSE